MESIVLMMMVKNESENIVSTLKPFSMLKNFLIYDTGSTDNTIEVIKDFLPNSVIIQDIFPSPFDYSQGRNNCLNYARDRFPNVILGIMIDAEWYITEDDCQKLINFCKSKLNDNDDAYFFSVEKEFLNKHNKIIRLKNNFQFIGEIHEYYNGKAFIDSNIIFKWNPTKSSKEKTVKRILENDIPIYLKKIECGTQTSRDIFYLAQSYQTVDDFINAEKYYKERIELEENTGLVNEEVFICYYRLGLIYKNKHHHYHLISIYKNLLTFDNHLQ